MKWIPLVQDLFQRRLVEQLEALALCPSLAVGGRLDRPQRRNGRGGRECLSVLEILYKAIQKVPCLIIALHENQY